ncbi:zinc finger RNA-binding protein 2-like [Sesamum indicum]|uniref:Zinc finger RNA-binding protein 2-like n=1 Tax=Sesamum indicum TaxID=4182 RepID=A0A6I9UF58_SESIN|nr:zinc finger RNA-binding protein 2-like [Sesamum indicum]
MDYTRWAEMQQYPNPNPNPNSDFSIIQTTNYPASYSYNTNPDPYQQPSFDPHNPSFLPQPQPQPQPQPRPPGVDPPYGPPLGVDPPYVPPLVTYAQQPVSFEHQQGAAAASYYPDPNVAWAAAVAQFGVAPYTAGVSAPNPAIQSHRRKTWKKMPSKTKVVQSAWCEVCKIDCNSKGVLDQHKLGKKHKKNLEKLKGATTVPVSAPVAAPPATVATSPAIVAIPPAIVATSPAIVAAAAAATEADSTPLPPSALGPVDKPTIGPEENPHKSRTSSSKKARKKAAARTEDLETKRRKVLEGGAAADGVRACSICNVVCNSDTVFNYHLAGQRHALMIKKQASTAEVAPAM